MPKQDTLTYWGLLGWAGVVRLEFFGGDRGVCFLIIFPSHSANFARLPLTDRVIILFPII